MKKLNIKDVTNYVEQNIGDFHQRRINSLEKLNLGRNILSKKNPYLFKAKNIGKATELVPKLIDAYISSSEESIFGNWLEGLAKFVCGKLYSDEIALKSSTDSVDFEFMRNGKRYILIIKSGPNWANSSQLAHMYSIFREVKKRIMTSGNKEEVIFVNGCCYGKQKDSHKFPKKGPDYYKYCGQMFWDFISENPNLYLELIEPLGYQAKERNEDYQVSYDQLVNRFTKQFLLEYCDENGSINWEKIVVFNSGIAEPHK